MKEQTELSYPTLLGKCEKFAYKIEGKLQHFPKSELPKRKVGHQPSQIIILEQDLIFDQSHISFILVLVTR